MDQGEDVHSARLLPAFKDNLLESQIPTWAFTLACTSDQFRTSWRSGPNHTSRMQTGPSLQRKGPGWVSLPLQAPSCKPSLLSKLTLAPAIRSPIVICPSGSEMSVLIRVRRVHYSKMGKVPTTISKTTVSSFVQIVFTYTLFYERNTTPTPFIWSLSCKHMSGYG